VRQLKSAVRGVARSTGFEIRRAGGTGRTMTDALQQLRRVGLAPNTIIDVGVAYGTPQLYSTFPEPTYLLVEALAEFEPDLKTLLATKVRGTYAIAVAGATSGTANLTVRGGGSTLYREADNSDAAAQIRQVPMVTIDELCRERALRGPYLMKVDVQGAELEVLAGALDVLRDTEAVVLEISLFELLLGIPVFATVIAAMSDYGFAAYDLFEGLARPADGALAQIDVAFVKTTGRFREHQGFR
jgi:FkbM family methyltransferase